MGPAAVVVAWARVAPSTSETGWLTVENSTFESNGAAGGNGSGIAFDAGGGGGGLGGNGGFGLDHHCGGGGGGSRGNGADGALNPNTVEVTCWGGGGGGTVTDAGGAGAFDPGFKCGGKGATRSDRPTSNDGHGATCLGGGGGGGQPFDAIVAFLGEGDGGGGSYGGGGGGGGAQRGSGGDGGFGGGGGGGTAVKDFFGPTGGDGGFGGGGGASTTAEIAGGGPGSGGSFAGNASEDHGGGGAGLGGAIFNQGGEVTVRNSTFTGNFAVRGLEGGAGAGRGQDKGGAIFSVGGELTVLNSTISSNGSTGDGAGIVVYEPTIDAETKLTLRNTIVADSIPGVRECFFVGSVEASGSGNLIENNSGCPGMDQTDDPQLGPLQLNAPGNTPTMEVPLTSPAVDAADAATSLLSDQRGVARPLSVGFDIGAFEAREPAADLALSKGTTSGTAIPGDTIVFNIGLANQGPDDATDVQLPDSLPGALTFVSCSATLGTCGSAGNDRTVSYPALAASANDQIRLTATLNFGVPDGTVITNTASIGAASPEDPDVGNNTASATVTVQNNANLLLTQSVAKLTNRQLRYTISVKNLGPYQARRIELNDPMPNGTKFVSVAQGPWSCTPLPVGSVGTLNCSLARLDLNASASLTFIVKTTAPGSVNISNTATASAGTFDPNAANNAATLVTRVSGK